MEERSALFSEERVRLQPIPPENTEAFAQASVFRAHFKNMDACLSSLYRGASSTLWKTYADKFIELVGYLKSEPRICDFVTQEFFEIFLSLMQEAFWEFCQDDAKAIECFEQSLILLNSGKVLESLAQENIRITIFLVAKYLEIKAPLAPQVVLNACRLMLEYFKMVPDFSFKNAILRIVSRQYAQIHEYCLSAIYGAYEAHCANQMANPHFVEEAQAHLLNLEVQFVYKVFYEKALLFLEGQIFKVAQSSLQDLQGFFKCMLDIAICLQLEQARICYNKLYKSVDHLLKSSIFPEEITQELTQYRRYCIQMIGEVEEKSLSSNSAEGEASSVHALAQKCQERRASLQNKRDQASAALKVHEIGKVSRDWTQSLDEFLYQLCEEVKQTLGPPPCEKFSILKLGSLARQEACLYSDFEFAIAWEGSCDENEAKSYFQLFTSLLELKIISLGETHKLFERGPDFALPLPGGLRFDDGGNYPFNGMVSLFGRPEQLKEGAMSPHANLWTYRDLSEAAYLTRGSHDTAVYVLIDSAYLYGDQALVEQIKGLQGELLKCSTQVQNQLSYAQVLGYALISNDLGRSFLTVVNHQINFKTNLLRFPQMWVASLALFHQIEDLPSFQRLEVLTTQGKISPLLAKLLTYCLRLALRWRLQAHNYDHCEQDQLNPVAFTETKTDLQLMCYLVEVIYPRLYEIFQAWKVQVSQVGVLAENFWTQASCTQSTEEIFQNLMRFVLLEAQGTTSESLFLLESLLLGQDLSQLDSGEQAFIEKGLEEIRQQGRVTAAIYHEFILPLLMWRRDLGSKQPIFNHLRISLETLADAAEQQARIQAFIQFMLKVNMPTRVFESMYQQLTQLSGDAAQYRQYRLWRYFYCHALDQALKDPDLAEGTTLQIKLAPVLEWMRNLPDHCGYRIQEYLQYQKLDKNIILLSLENLDSASEASASSHSRVQLKRSNGQVIELHPDVIKRIFRDNGHLKHMVKESKASTAHVHRSVAFLDYQTSEGRVQLHFKEHPDFPIMAYASDILSWRICGHGSVPNELVLFEIYDQDHSLLLWYPVLISLSIQVKIETETKTFEECVSLEETLARDYYPRVPKDTKRLSELFILEVLKHSGDGFPRNYMLIQYTEHEFGFACVDNEQMFVYPFIQGKLKECNIIYCLPEFQVGELAQKLDRRAWETFKNLKVDELIKDWINSIQSQERQYASFLNDAKLADLGRERSSDYPLIYKMEFSGGMLYRLKTELNLTKNLAEEVLLGRSTCSPKDFIKRCSGGDIADKYFRPGFQSPSKHFYSIVDRRVTSSSKEYLKYFHGENEQRLSMEEAISEMKRFEQEDAALPPELRKEMQGLWNRQSIFRLDCRGLDEAQQRRRFEVHLSSPREFKGLSILGCEAILEDDDLRRLLAHSRESLEFLSIYNHSKLTERSILYLSSFPNLKTLVASGIGARDISKNVIAKVEFPALGRLILNHCPLLEYLYLSAPLLTYLSAADHPNLRKIKLALPSVESAFLQGNRSTTLLELSTRGPAIVNKRGLPENCQKKLSGMIKDAPPLKHEAFRTACRNGQMDTVKYLFEHLTREEVMQPDQNGATPFYIACQEGKLEVVEYLFGKLERAEVMQANRNGATPFYIACQEGKLEVVEYLFGELERAELMRPTNWGGTPFYVACYQGKLEVVQYLFGRLTRAEVMQAKQDGVTPFASACYNGKLEVVRYLFDCLERGEVMQPDQNGATPFYIACWQGKLEVVRYLFERLERAEVMRPFQNGQTPFASACCNGRFEVAQYLFGKLERGEVMQPTQTGATPFYIACQEGKLEVVEYLFGELERAELMRPTNWGGTPFYVACREGKLEVVQYLFEKLERSGVMQPTQTGATPFWVACHQGKLAVVEYLFGELERAELMRPTNWGGTPFYVACREGKLEVVQYLFGKLERAEVMQAKQDGMTPFASACYNGKLEVVQYLFGKLERAEVMRSHQDGRTPFYVACYQGRLKVVQYLFGKLERAEVMQPDRNGATPFWVACGNGKLEVVEYLFGKLEREEVMRSTNWGGTPFYIACERGKLEVVQYLFGKLERGEVMQPDRNGATPFYVACQEGKLAVVEYLFGHLERAEVMQPDQDGATPFYIACHQGKLEVVEYLFERLERVEVMQPDQDGATPFYIACHQGKLAVVEYLFGKLERGEVMRPTNWGGTPFYAACQKGRLEVVRYLFEHLDREEVMLRDESGRTPFYDVCYEGKIEVVEYLFERLERAEVMQPNQNGSTAFYVACREGNLEVVEYLFGHLERAEVMQPDQDGATPFYIACHQGKLEVVEYLFGKLERGEVMQPDRNGATPFYVACQEGKLAVVEYLFGHLERAEVMQPDQDGATPFYIACHQGKLEVVEYLFGKLERAEVMQPAQDGATPFWAACWQGKLEVVRYLFDRLERAEVMQFTNWRATPFYIACHQGKLEVVQYLFERLTRAEVMQPNEDGATSFWVACETGELEVVRYLFERLERAEVMQPNQNGSTAFYVACREGNLEVVEYLFGHLERAEVMQPEQDGATPFYAACHQGKFEVVQYLFGKLERAEVMQANRNGATPFLIACREGKIEVVEYLFERLERAEIMQPNKYGRTPFYVACREGKFEVVQYLINNLTPKEIMQGDQLGITPFFVACQEGRLDIVKLLFQGLPKEKLLEANQYGVSPFYVACYCGQLEIVQFLLPHLSLEEIRQANSQGKTPLEAAESQNHLEIIFSIHQHIASLKLVEEENFAQMDDEADSHSDSSISLDFDFFYEMALVGDIEIKTDSSLGQYLEAHCLEDPYSTRGVRYGFESFAVEDHEIELRFWDTVGNGHWYSFNLAMYYRRCDFYWVFFDVTDRTGFQEVSSDVDRIKKFNPSPRFLLIATQEDPSKERVVSYEEAQALSQKIGALGYLECSALAEQGIHEVFQTTAELVHSLANTGQAQSPILEASLLESVGLFSQAQTSRAFLPCNVAWPAAAMI